MANANPSRIGQVNKSGATDELFLKVFAGEVLTSFEKATVFTPRTMSRTISAGKSASFPVVGRNTAGYHTPGSEILGNNIGHSEVVITIDQLLVSPVFIASIDDAMNHWDVRSEYSKQCGLALAYEMDKHIAAMALKAARSPAILDGFDGGSTIVNANFRTDSNALAAGLFEAAKVFDEKHVPDSERFCFLPPALYYLLAQNTTAINSQFGGSGAYKDGTVVKIAGIELVKTNHLPQSNAVGTNAKYQIDGTNTAAIVMQKGAVGTVKLLDMAVESEYDIRRQGTLALAKYAVGHGVLRPEMCVELAVA